MSERADLGGRPPLSHPELIGRRGEIETTLCLVDQCRLVTLTGPAGIGKTRIAIEVARRVQDTHVTRVALVELAPITDSGHLVPALASALGLRVAPGRDPLDVLVTELASLNVMVVFDNCEHVLDAAAGLVERLLGDCGGVRVLATSQRPLGITGESVEVVPPLSLPQAAPVSPEEALAESDAVALFCARASTVGNFELTAEALPAVVQICRHLDGVPLAIELAAARTAVMGADDIAERLEHRFSLLTKGSAHAPPRHRTLRAAMEWTYDLLDDSEAMVLSRMSVFVGGASLPAIIDVVSGDGADRADIAEVVTSLLDRSLVATVAEPRTAATRYRLSETVRAYASERLAEAGEERLVQSRFAQWCLQRAEAAAALEGSGAEWAADLEVEQANLRAGLEWAIDAEPLLGMRLAVALIGFWEAQGYLSEGKQWLQRAIQQPDDAPAQLQVEALTGLAMMAVMGGDAATAQKAAKRCLTVARRSGAQLAGLGGEEEGAQLEVRAMHLSGFISVLTQQSIQAKPLLEEALSRARARGHPVALGDSLVLYGRACLLVGAIDDAERAFEECLRLSPGHNAVARFNLGCTASAAGRDLLAQEHFEAVLAVAANGGQRFHVPLALSYLAELAWARGDLDGARKMAEEGRDLAREVGAPYPEARCVCELAKIAWSEGDEQAAMRLAREACWTANSAATPHARVLSQQVRGRLAQAADDPRAARRDYEEALDTAEDMGDRLGMAASLRFLGRLNRTEGAHDEAIERLKRAITLEADTGAGLSGALENLAAIGVDQGHVEFAASLFGAADTLRASGGPYRRPDEAAGYEADLVALRKLLPEPRLADAWAAGSKLSRPEAVALALAYESPSPKSHSSTELTASERRITNMIAQGMTSAQIGEELGISKGTVRGHAGRARAKLRLRAGLANDGDT